MLNPVVSPTVINSPTFRVAVAVVVVVSPASDAAIGSECDGVSGPARDA